MISHHVDLCCLSPRIAIRGLSERRIQMSWSHGQVTMAKAIGNHETVWLCVFGVLGLMPFATVRACTNPPVALPNGEGLHTNFWLRCANVSALQQPLLPDKMLPAPCNLPIVNIGRHALRPWFCRHCWHTRVWSGGHQLTICA